MQLSAQVKAIPHGRHALSSLARGDDTLSGSLFIACAGMCSLCVALQVMAEGISFELV